MENLDESQLQQVLGGQTPNLIPESLITALTVGFIALNVISVLFLIVYVLSFIHKWKMQSAVLKMQKDVAEIKAALNTQPAKPMAPIIDTNSKTIAAKQTSSDNTA